MPELPEVETVCRGLAMKMEGRVLTRVEQRRPNLRIPFPERMVERLTGRRVVTIRRRAKYILIHLDDDQVLIVHLGMSGRMTIGQDLGPPGAHDHVLLTTDDGSDIRFNDARRFGLMAMTGADALDSHPLLASLGPEPLGNEFNAETLSRALKSQDHADQIGPARPDGRGGPWQHICVRGAVPGRDQPEADRRDRGRTRAPSGWCR